MGSIVKKIEVRSDATEVWDAMRDYGAVHERVVPGFVVESQLDGSDRVITFDSGAVARERLVSLDDERRRLVYTVTESGLGFEHHQSSVKVLDVVARGRRGGEGEDEGEGEGCSQIIWTTDLLPDELDGVVEGLMNAGAEAMTRRFGGSGD
jgi:hypothetical protein